MMARRRKKGLSERQKRILQVLEDYQQQNGYPPSIREICKDANISSTSVVNYYLEQLQDKGFIERDSGVSRGIRIVKTLSDVGAAVQETAAIAQRTAERAQQIVEEMLRIPVMGRIVAGEPCPIPASDFSYFDADEMVHVASTMLPAREQGNPDLYALEVQGDSMIDAMINDGDIVIMKRAAEARNGEMVAVWLNDREETTLKYFYLEGGRVRLQPANPTIDPIFVDDPSVVQVQGKVVMVIRKIGSMVS